MLALYIIPIGFILFDIITGVIKGAATTGFHSTKMRIGGLRKIAEVVALVGSGLLEYAMHYIKLGVELPLLNIVAVYLCIMELISILENLSEVSPTLNNLFKPYLENLRRKEDENNDV